MALSEKALVAKKARDRAYYIKHRDKIKARSKAYQLAHPEVHRLSCKKYLAANPPDLAAAREYANKTYSIMRFREARYGLTVEAAEQLLKSQDYACAVCLRKFADIPSKRRNGPMVVDHDHVTGKVRGLLCDRCNQDMRPFDNVECFNRLLEYKYKHC